MAKAVFILGLAGAGKTYHANQMMREHTFCLFEEGFLVFDFNTGQFDPEKTQANVGQLVDHLRKGQDCIVIEGGFIFKAAQDWILHLLKPDAQDAEIVWLCFENDQAKAALNARRRPGGDYEGNIRQNRRNSPLYHYPKGAIELPIVTDWT